jgi:hypothetical protein
MRAGMDVRVTSSCSCSRVALLSLKPRRQAPAVARIQADASVLILVDVFNHRCKPFAFPASLCGLGTIPASHASTAGARPSTSSPPPCVHCTSAAACAPPSSDAFLFVLKPPPLQALRSPTPRSSSSSSACCLCRCSRSVSSGKRVHFQSSKNHLLPVIFKYDQQTNWSVPCPATTDPGFEFHQRQSLSFLSISHAADMRLPFCQSLRRSASSSAPAWHQPVPRSAFAASSLWVRKFAALLCFSEIPANV